MSATNSTPNYGLPQYVADDKPTYLGDFNKAMLDIDTNMKSIDNKAVSAESAVETANSNATQAINTANEASQTAQTAQATATTAKTTADTAKETAETAKSTADTAKETADTAKETADTAKSTADNLNTRVTNLENFDPEWTEPVDIKKSGFTGSFNCSYSKKLKLLTLFGRLDKNPIGTGDVVLGVLPEECRPTSERIVYNACYEQNNNLSLTLYFRPNGDIVWPNTDTNLQHFNIRFNETINWSFWK